MATENTANIPDDAVDDGVELLAAASEGRADELLRILQKNPDLIQIVDLAGNNALHLAARAGHTNTIDELLSVTREKWEMRKFLVEVNVDGDTALHLALKNAHDEAADRLLRSQSAAREEDKAVDVVNNDGVSPRDLINQSGNNNLLSFIGGRRRVKRFTLVDLEMELALCALEDDHDHEPRVTWRGLRVAAKKGQEDKVLWILGEDPTLVQHIDEMEGTAVHVAARAGQASTLRQLVQFIMDNLEHELASKVMLAKDILGDTALHTALKNELVSESHYLVSVVPQGSYQVNIDGVSPLYIAVEKMYEELVRYMVSQCKLLSKAMKDALFSRANKFSPAHAAIKTRNLGMLQALMEELPFLINLSDRKGWKPLSYAAHKGYLEGVRYLFKLFPDSIQNRDADGTFPIHKAVAGGHLNIVKEFLASRPQTLFDIDKKGRTILHIATRYQYKGEVFSYLTKDDKRIEKIFHTRDLTGKTFMELANELKNGSVCG